MPGPNWVREYQDDEIVPGTPYRVIRLMGAGGMGSVYEVEHIELGRRYVLKSLLCTLTSRKDLIARMRNEWRALGQLDHRNIVDVVNAGATSTGVPYYVMELLVGETVRDRLAREERLAVSEAVRIAQGVLLGLDAAHEIGIIHRDVKPANVFLTREKLVKVLDFGVAQVREYSGPKITAKGLAIGTPRYMSPEQALGETADARSDVYAAGLLLYEMIVGEGPFDDVTEQSAQMQAHLNRIPPKLHEKAFAPPGLSEIVARALEKEPAQRFASGREMATALAPFVTAPWPNRGSSAATPTPARVTPRPSPAVPKVAVSSAAVSQVKKATPSRETKTVPEPPEPLITRGTLIGASLVAAAIVGATIYVAQRVLGP
jgi:serine/threonine-protein kinase